VEGRIEDRGVEVGRHVGDHLPQRHPPAAGRHRLQPGEVAGRGDVDGQTERFGPMACAMSSSAPEPLIVVSTAHLP
jgi:hypothetical protein